MLGRCSAYTEGDVGSPAFLCSVVKITERLRAGDNATATVHTGNRPGH